MPADLIFYYQSRQMFDANIPFICLGKILTFDVKVNIVNSFGPYLEASLYAKSHFKHVIYYIRQCLNFPGSFEYRANDKKKR